MVMGPAGTPVSEDGRSKRLASWWDWPQTETGLRLRLASGWDWPRAETGLVLRLAGLSLRLASWWDWLQAETGLRLRLASCRDWPRAETGLGLRLAGISLRLASGSDSPRLRLASCWDWPRAETGLGLRLASSWVWPQAENGFRLRLGSGWYRECHRKGHVLSPVSYTYLVILYKTQTIHKGEFLFFCQIKHKYLGVPIARISTELLQWHWGWCCSYRTDRGHAYLKQGTEIALFPDTSMSTYRSMHCMCKSHESVYLHL